MYRPARCLRDSDDGGEEQAVKIPGDHGGQDGHDLCRDLGQGEEYRNI